MAKYRKKPIEVEAEQFDPVKNPRPKGFHSWDDEEACPRDMSWGYVVTIHNQRAHIQAGDRTRLLTTGGSAPSVLRGLLQKIGALLSICNTLH